MAEVKIIGMTEEELLSLKPNIIDRLMAREEVIYLAKTLGSYWEYNYEAAEQGRVGMHAELKSLRHSDGFFVSKILLQYPNIRAIIANQLVFRFNQLGIPKPDWVAGIPDGATELGENMARLIGVKNAEMKKEEGCIRMVSHIPAGETLLLVEDFCTRGTGFTEAVLDIISKQFKVEILPYELVIINRGGLSEIPARISRSFKLIAEVVAVVTHRVNDWEPSKCPLCQNGSTPIKPKATDENWRLITTSQQ